ncbi:zinc finger CW-type PWWP domain protein 1-like isoform X4 [Leucoraja erinacea]|uniref:zinc finger CW-type PWWP domain protein 1-like isoform X4 n=1 Tax=Leucoraja erinaceus TaxID=7782 RepID=UPI00245792B3|nr:zinc finger CW-type PWWP domain protein 1-like isoform X4 [Leucoraja erinacea]
MSPSLQGGRVSGGAGPAELRKLCCSDDADAIEMTATSNGIEKDIKKSGNFVAPTVKDILKLKKKKEVLCENSSTEIKGQNGESTEDVCLDMERKGQKNFALKQKKSVLEQKQAKTCLDEGCVNKPGKINNKNPEEKVKHKTKCVGRTAKPNKEIPTLSDSQYEMIFQSVIDKSLEECIDEASEVNKERRKHKRKGQPKKIVPDYTRFIDDDEETAIDNYVAWAQCGRKMCGKWRRLKDNVDPATLAKDWTCSQNPDPLYNSCDLPEEAWDGKDNDIIYAELVPGSIVWAKQSGYPWWPAMVEHDPQSGKYFMFTSDSDQCPSKYHVTFFDNIVTHAWISVSLIKSFQENPRDKSISKRDFAKRINAGRKMAEAAQKVKIQDRLPLFGFAVRYKANGDAELSEDYSSQESLEISWNVKETQRSTSREVEEDRNKDSVFKASIVAETQQEKARKEKGKY